MYLPCAYLLSLDPVAFWFFRVSEAVGDLGFAGTLENVDVVQVPLVQLLQ